MTGDRSISVLVVDDHPVVRRGVRGLVDDAGDIEVIAEATDADEATRKARAHHPDVVVLDLVMPGAAAIDAIPQLCGAGAEVVVLTVHSEPAYARAAMRAGAAGFVVKEAAPAALVDAIRRVAAGGTYLDPELGTRVAREREGPVRPAGLSDREAEILGLVALGHTNQEVAERLFLSVRTIEAHRSRIQQKLGFRSRSELVSFALDHDLIDKVRAGD